MRMHNPLPPGEVINELCLAPLGVRGQCCNGRIKKITVSACEYQIFRHMRDIRLGDGAFARLSDIRGARGWRNV
jgi:hypothetical protein